MTVGEKIVETRKAKGVTQKQLAEMTGIPVQTLVRYEKASNIPISRLEAIANALEVSEAHLIGRIEYDNDLVQNTLEVLKENGVSNEAILSSFTTQELAEEIAKRCGE